MASPLHLEVWGQDMILSNELLRDNNQALQSMAGMQTLLGVWGHPFKVFRVHHTITCRGYQGIQSLFGTVSCCVPVVVVVVS